MARNVPDLALFLDAMAAEAPHDPLSFAPPTQSFAEAVAAPRAPRRVAFSPDLGLPPVARETRALCAAAAERFAEIGAIVEEAAPDLRDATAIFMALRGLQFAIARGPLLETHRAQLKADIIWNTELGLKLSAAEIADAERRRAALYHRVLEFFERYDLLLCPCRPVPAFDVMLRHPEAVDGVTFETYISSSALTYAITLAACPALSIPCGFDSTGRAIGLQMVARPRNEAGLLQAAALFEQMSGLDKLLPIDPRPGTVPKD